MQGPKEKYNAKKVLERLEAMIERWIWKIYRLYKKSKDKVWNNTKRILWLYSESNV